MKADLSRGFALILGGAACLDEDLAAAAALGITEETAAIIATNHAGRDRPGRVDAWASFHAELFNRWIAEREAAGRPPALMLWTAERPLHEPQMPPNLHLTSHWGGSSGLLAVAVALELGFRRIVLCGVPMTAEGEHYDRAGLWIDAGNYRRAWLDRAGVLAGRVRSMSGWTRDMLGEPDSAWLFDPPPSA